MYFFLKTLRFYVVQAFCLENEQNHHLLSKWKAEDRRQNKLTNGSQQSQSDKNRISQMNNDFDVIDTSLCSHTQWSSLFPDPKSTITGIDPNSGLLLP